MSESSQNETVCLASISIDISGKFANPAELNLRKQIEENIGASGVGPCVGSGTGMGSMDVEFLVKSEEEARPLIETVMSESFPGQSYKLDFMITEGKPEDFIEEKGGCGKGAAAAVFILCLIPVAAWQTYHWIF